MKSVDDCLMHNGTIYAETTNLDGMIVEVCKLAEEEAHACKYYRVVKINGNEPARLCLYEVCTYEHHCLMHNKVFAGPDFVMRLVDENENNNNHCK